MALSKKTSSRRRWPMAVLISGVVVSAGGVATTSWAADDVLTVGADRTVYLTDGGDVTVNVTLTTSSGQPTSQEVSVDYATGTGTAQTGDYTAASGKVSFPSGSASGATKAVTIKTTARTGAATALTIPVTLSSSDAQVPAVNQPVVVINGHGMPYQDKNATVDSRAADLLSRMTVEEKVGQMFQAGRNQLDAQATEITSRNLGSMMTAAGNSPSPNTAQAWADEFDKFQARALATRLQIPLLYGTDAVHGNGNLRGATIFPHNIGLGATRDPALVKQAAAITAAETRPTGPNWVFGPCLCVARDIRWGRTYESFGEDPDLVTSFAGAVSGLQGDDPADLAAGDKVLASAKHYAGDGATTFGTSTTQTYTIDRGVTRVSRADFARLALAPYQKAITDERVGSVMTSFSSVDFTDDGLGNPVRMTGNKELLTDQLKTADGFDGIVISGWEAIHDLGADAATQVTAAVNAGVDMLMEPTQFRTYQAALLAEVQAGSIPQARIDDAVTRILRQKFAMGLFDKPMTDRTGIDQVGSAEHRAVARQAVAQSQVLLQNKNDALPLTGTGSIYVAGSGADNLGYQAGGWTLSWSGFSGNDLPGATSILQGITKAAPQAKVTFSADASTAIGDSEVGIVAVAETPYAEGTGDVGNKGRTLALSAADQTAVDTVCAAVNTCVVLVVSGRPLLIGDALAASDAVVASWLPGSEGQGVADVLFGQRPFTGKLPVTWPRIAEQEPINVGDATYDPQFAFGFGLTTKAS